MKRIVVTGKGQCALEDIDDPRVADNYAKVKIYSAPMCAEFHQFLSGDTGPLGGHEAAGEVIEVGPRATRVKPGDHVVVMPSSGCGVCDLCLSGDHIYCQDKKDPNVICGIETGTTTYAQYCVQQDWLLVSPRTIPFRKALQTCGERQTSMQSAS